MKNKNTKNNVYRTFGFGAIKAPGKPEGGVKSDKTVSKGDLRVGKK